MGMSSQSKSVLDSLASAARQSSTTAHWEEGQPDYWSMGTDNRATALAIDALVTLSPNDPLIPKAVRWLMTAEKEGHWLSTQETSISLIALAHYIAQSKELGADYTFQVDAFGKTLGQGVAASTNLTQTQTFTLPVSQMPVNNLGDLGLSRSADKGKMYYQMSLRYYVPGEGIKSKSEGLAITRSYYKMTNGVESADPVKEVNAGDLVKVRLTIVAPETSYYVLVTDPLPAGLEGVNGSLNTTSFTERPPNPFGAIQPVEGRAATSPRGISLGPVRQRRDARRPHRALRHLHEPRHLRLRILRPRHHPRPVHGPPRQRRADVLPGRVRPQRRRAVHGEVKCSE